MKECIHEWEACDNPLCNCGLEFCIWCQENSTQAKTKTKNQAKEKQMYNNEFPDNDKTPIYDNARLLRAVTPLELIIRASDVCMQKGNHHLLAAEEAVDVNEAMEHLSMVEIYADKVAKLREHADRFMKDVDNVE